MPSFWADRKERYSNSASEDQEKVSCQVLADTQESMVEP
jgi:hypothetical protein